MAVKLVDLELDEMEMLSVVDKGASGDKRVAPLIVIMKRDTQHGGSKVAKNFDEILAGLDEESRAVVQAAMAAAAAPAPAPVDVPKAEGDPEKKPDDTKPKDEPAPKLEEEKLPEPVQKALKDGRDAQAALVKLGKRMQTLEDEASMVKFEKRAADMPYLAMRGSDLAKVLKNASANLDAADFAKLDNVLKSASNVISTSNVLREHGGGGGEDGSFRAKLESIAKKLREQDPKISIQKARLMASELNPDVYAAAQAEQHDR